MPDEKHTLSDKIGEMHKRREIMSDGKRYLIYYTFDPNVATSDAKTKSSKDKVAEGERPITRHSLIFVRKFGVIKPTHKVVNVLGLDLVGLIFQKP